jgi:psiF repeat
MGTCKFGADDQHLQGKARSAFMKKCMSNQDEPRGAASAPSVPPARH